MITLWRSIRVTIVFAIMLGLVYPLVITGIGGILFPFQAQGSMIQLHGQVVGSELIAQPASDPRWFYPRPSAVNYAANGSGGSNLGPTNPALEKEVQTNEKSLGLPTFLSSIPPEMVESSGSGLDPDISPQAALLQVPRVAQATGLGLSDLQSLVRQNEEGRLLGIWGEPMVNVMKLNVALARSLGR